MKEWTLLDKCCELCEHSIEYPCRRYISCRLNGPYCHSSEECKKKIERRLYEIKYGKNGFKIKVPMASCTLAAGAEEVYNTVLKVVKELDIKADISITGCMGLCYIDPWIELIKDGYPPAIYANVKPDDVEEIIKSYLEGDFSKAYALRYRVGKFDSEKRVPTLDELDAWKYQVRWVSRNCGIVNPESLEEYIAYGGYKGLERALKMKPEEVIEELKKAGLRGRGGAGFPTWLKWKICREQPSDVKYVIANADEGDPGAFMNRLLAESDPFRIIEGLTIAAYAIGAEQGFIFVRAEKPLMAERLAKAVEEARKYGLLGKNILGRGFNFDIEVILSAGAFVCGEETALIAAIEGRTSPRQRPPYPATKGLWGKPTVINNVETLAHVATIMAYGWQEFAKYGTEKSKGTKMFCVTGAVRRTGAYEVPLGTPIRILVEKIAGGVREGRKIKAVQIGGPSGGCIPADLLDLPLDYEGLKQAGAIMGSGGIVVIDDSSCMVDVAKFFTSFTVAESCGKCIPCRVGMKILYDLMNKITNGEATIEDLETLEDLGNVIKLASLCALGGTAPNPILSTLRYFKDEYLAHVKEKRCPTKVCKKLVTYEIIEELCKGCGSCAKVCPVNAITRLENGKYSIDQSKCIKCGQCIMVCPVNAIVKR